MVSFEIRTRLKLLQMKNTSFFFIINIFIIISESC